MKIIVAYAKNTRVIGRGGSIPWVLPEDLQNFKRLTLNSIVVMGRETWFSLPNKARPLPQRINIVLSSTISKEIEQESIYVCRTIKEVLSFLPTLIFPRLTEAPNGVYVIGGESIYRQFLELDTVKSIVASEIHKDYEGDRYFPVLSDDWKRRLVKQFPSFDLVEYHKG